MKENGKRLLCIGCVFNIVFIIWTLLIQRVDVRPLGVRGTNIGFATINCWFHKLTGVHMKIYTITDWLGLVPIFICVIFGVIGFVQWIKRRSIHKVDYDIILLGIYYILVIFGYLIFEMIPINYRPILIEGFLEASYPSSTTGNANTYGTGESQDRKCNYQRNCKSSCYLLFSIYGTRKANFRCSLVDRYCGLHYAQYGIILYL